ncbi:MAG: hypothetical protein HY910_09630 [Desulfarculus sp.]|nr:hypothetical protein [Desulfarculus sp.]
MKPEDYGDNYKAHLLEQYKLFVEMADRVSARRAQANRYYIALTSALLAFMALVGSGKLPELHSPWIYRLVALVGMLLNAVWLLNIESFRQLNSGKFKVIHKLEQQLPFACYDEEWTELGRGDDTKRYRQLTRVEKFVPVLFTVPYLLLLFFWR